MEHPKVTIQRIGSPIGRPAYQEANLRGLGLCRANQIRVLEDTPSIRGMMLRVHHLIKIID